MEFAYGSATVAIAWSSHRFEEPGLVYPSLLESPRRVRWGGAERSSSMSAWTGAMSTHITNQELSAWIAERGERMVRTFRSRFANLSPQDIDEAFSQACTNTLAAMAEDRGPLQGKLSSYMHRVMHNNCLMVYRKEKPKEWIDGDTVESGLDSVDKQMMQATLIQDIRDCIRSLEQRLRDLIERRHYHGERLGAIGQRWGWKTAKTARKHTAALVAIHDCLETKGSALDGGPSPRLLRALGKRSGR